MNPHKKVIIDALRVAHGDDLYRAQCAFQGMNAEQMMEQHGESGKTRQQIIDEYSAHESKIMAAIRWMEAFP